MNKLASSPPTWLITLTIIFPFLLTLVWSISQDPAGPILRVKTYSVVVDVVVTDDSNRPVRGLTAEDFTVLEDDVPQEIVSFEEIGLESQPQPTTSRPPQSADQEPVLIEADEALSSVNAPNLMIMLLDHATVEYLNQKYIRDAAVEYIRKEIRPNDYMAVFQVGMSLHFLQGFTNDKEALVQAVSRSNPTGSIYATDQAGLVGRADAAQDQVELLTTQINSIAGSQAAPNNPAIAMLLEMLNQQMEIQQRLEGTYYAQLSYSREQQSRPVIGAIETIARGVRHIPGRKTLVLFSQGFSVPLTLERPLYRAVDAANRANLAIYAIDGGGLQVRAASTEGELFDISALRSGDRVKAYGGLSQFDRAREIGSDQKDSTLRYLANATGGLLIRHTNDFLDALRRVDRDVRSHYVLTYRPKDLNFQGEFRTIRVEVKRPDVDVRARSGYWAVPPGASLLSADEFRELIELSSGKTTTDKQFEVESRLLHFPGSQQDYDVYLAIEAPLLAFSPRTFEEEVFVDLDVTGIVTDSLGEVVTSFRGPSRLRLDPARKEQTEYLRMESRLNLTPGNYGLLLSVSDPVTGKVAYQRHGLRLPALKEGPAASSLVLAKKSELLSAARRDPFTVKGMRLTPSVAREFSTTEELIYLLNIYHPKIQDKEPQLDLELELFRQGRSVGFQQTRCLPSEVSNDPIPHMKLARYLSLENLQPGSYFLRLTVTHPESAESSTSQAAFQIVH